MPRNMKASDLRRARTHRARRRDPSPMSARSTRSCGITTTTICGTDVHILKGEYPVESGLTIGHEPVGVIEKLGSPSQGTRRANA